MRESATLDVIWPLGFAQGEAVAVPQELPGAASALLHAVVTGGPRCSTVLAAFPRALYLSVPGDGDAADSGEEGVGQQVLAIVGAGALRLPCSIVLAPSIGLDLSTLAHGQEIIVGAGRVHLPGATIKVARWWQPPRPQSIRKPMAAQIAALQRQLPQLPAAMTEPVRRLREATNNGTNDGHASSTPGRQARALVGLGPGLTPAGDDVLAALLVTLSAGPTTARNLGTSIAATVLPGAETRTTALSAALLRHAARGDGIPQLIDLVNVVGGDTRHAASALPALLDVGSSSGLALAHGVLLAAQCMMSRAGSTSTVSEVA